MLSETMLRRFFEEILSLLPARKTIVISHREWTEKRFSYLSFRASQHLFEASFTLRYVPAAQKVRLHRAEESEKF
jgi:hypothetical protein